MSQLPPPPSQQPGYAPPGAPAYAVQPSTGMAIAALVLGILAVINGIIPFMFWLAIPLGILALIFGIVGISKANQQGGAGRGMAIAGLVTGIIGAVLGILWIVAWSNYAA